MISESISGISETKIIKAQIDHETIIDRMDTLNNSLRYFTETKDLSYKKNGETIIVSESDRATHIGSINRELEELQDELSVNDHTPIFQLDKDISFEQIVILISWLSIQLNLTNGLSEDQQEIIAITIQTQYAYLGAEDIALCFKNGTQGKYGKVFNRLDVGVVCIWINEYVASKKQKIMIHRDKAYSSAKESNYDHKKQVQEDKQAYNTHKAKYLNAKTNK